VTSNKEIIELTKELLEDYRNNKVGASRCFVFQNEETLLIKRRKDSRGNIVGTDCSPLPMGKSSYPIKDKIIPPNNIVGYIRVRGTPNLKSFTNLLIEELCKLGIERTRVSFNELGEIYVDSLKVVGLDFKRVDEQGNSVFYFNFFIFINRDSSLDKKIEAMQNKSIYGYLSELYVTDSVDYNSFFNSLRGSLISFVANFTDSTPVKEAPYSKTVSYIKRCFENIGITFKEEIENPFKNIWFCNISNEEYNISQQGKGTTKEVCLASGYAEVMERFQNLSFCINYGDYLKNTQNSFKFFPDEKLGKGGICIPFYEVKSQEIKYLPIGEVWSKCKSNGMTAGNSSSEAIVAGICEIFERFAERYIYDNKLTPPTVSREFIQFNYPKQYEMILEIEKAMNVDIIVKDASLNKGLPVLFIVLVDKKNVKYRKTFGAHPIFEEALNRCLTECVQRPGVTSIEIRTSKFSDAEESGYYNSPYYTFMRACGHLGSVSIPWFVFYNKPSWEFKSWGMKDTINNKKEALHLIAKALEFSSAVFIRSNNFLGFPTFYIYIPGLSEITPYSVQDMDEKLSRWIRREYSIGNELPKAISFMENYRDRLCLIELPRKLILVILYLKNKDYEKAISLLRTFPPENRVYRALSLEISMLKDGVPAEERDGLLRLYFEESIVNEIKEYWREDFEKIFIKEKYGKNVPLTQDKITLIKSAMLKRVEDQQSIGKLISSWQEFSKD
jgi:YcaO-like protein with predicted kinase domain